MSSIDERVVEMKFDNDQFESGIQQSTNSLDKLKNSLNLEGAEKGLNNVSNAAKNLDMEGVTAAVKSTENSFSALETVATAALVKITDQAISTGEELLASLSVDQISAGYDKYTQKLANVQTIMNSTGESVETVNGYMDHLMWYSDETSYGFTDMTNALATMVATGGEVETLIPMIEGVANATAYAGKNAEAFSYVISAINSSYSRGYMQATDWARIEHQTVASEALKETLIETAEAMGKVEEGAVNIENFRTTLNNGDTKGWLDTEVMEEGFGKFAEMTEAAYDLIEAGEFDTATEAYAAIRDQFDDVTVAASEAAQQAKTFGESFEATTDAVSSAWSIVMESIFGDYDQAIKLWTDLSESLYDIFAEPVLSIGDVFSTGFGDDWDLVEKQIDDAGVSVKDFEEAFKSAADSNGLGRIIDETDTLSEAFRRMDNEARTNVVSDALDLLCESTGEVTTSFEELEDVARRVWNGEFGNGEERIQALTEAGYDYEAVQTVVNQLINDGTVNWEDFSDAELENLGYTEEQIEALHALKDSLNDADSTLSKALNRDYGLSGFEAFWGALSNIGESIVAIGKSISSAWSDVFSPFTGEDLRLALNSFYGFTKSLTIGDETASKLQSTFRGLFSIVDMGKDTISTFASGAFGLLKDAISKCNIDILGIIANIGDAIYSFHNWFSENEIAQKAFDKLSNGIKTAKNGIVSFVESIEQLPQVQKITTEATNIFNGAVKKLESAFPGTTKAIKDFIENFTDFAHLDIDGIIDIFKKFGDELKSLIKDTFPETIQKVKDFIASFKDGFSNLSFKDMGDIIKTFKDEFVKAINDFIDSSDTLTAIKTKLTTFFDDFQKTIGVDFNEVIGSIKGFINDGIEKIKGFLKDLGLISDENMEGLTNPLKKVSDGLGTLGDVAGTVSGPIETLKTAFSNFKSAAGEFFSGFIEKIQSINIGQIVGVAVAIIALVGALQLILSVMNISTAVSNITRAIKDLTKSFKAKSFGTTLLEAAAAIGILVASLIALAQLPTADLVTSAGVLVVLAGALGGLVAVMGVLSKKGMTGGASGAATYIGMAVAILGIVAALEMLNGIDLSWDLAGKLAIIVGIIAALTTAMTFINKTSSVSAKGYTNALTLVGFAAAIIMVVKALEDITNMSVTAGDVLALVGIMTALVVVMKVLSGVTGAWATIGSAVTLLAIPIALKLMLSALNSIANYDTKKIIDSIENFVLIFGELVALAAVSRLAGSGGGASLLAMSASLLVMSAAIAMLGSIKEDSLKNGLAAVTQLMLVLGVVEAAMAIIGKIPGSGKASSIASTISIVAAIVALAIAVAALSAVDPESLKSATAAIMELGVVFSVMEGLSALTKFSKPTSILALTATIGVIAVALAELSKLDPTGVSTAADAITQLGLVFSAMEGLSALTKFANAGNIAVLMAAVAVIGLVLGLLANYTDAGDLASVANSLTECMVGFSAAMVAIAGAGAIAAAAGAGITALLPVLGTLAAVVAAIVVVATILDNTAAGGYVMKAFEYLGDLIGTLVGALAGEAIATAVKKISTVLPDIKKIVNAISPLGTAFSDFADSFKDINGETVEKIGTLALAVSELAAADFISSLSTLIGKKDSFEQLGDGLTTIADAMKDFGEAAKDISEEDFNHGVDMIDALSEAQSSLQKVGGLVEIFTGVQSWDSLSSGLPELGEALKDFSDSISGATIDEDEIKTACDAIKKLSDAQESIESVGGLADIMGKHKWSTLSTDLDTMAQALVDFSTTIREGGLDKDAATQIGYATDALTVLAEAQGQIEGVGGIVQKIVGDTKWDTLSVGLKEMGEAIADFSNAVSNGGEGINKKAIKKAVEAIELLANAQGDMSGTGGVFHFFTGNKKWDTLAEGLDNVGAGLVSLSNAGEEIDSDAIEKAIKAIESVSELSTLVTNYEINYDWIVDNLENLGTSIANFGNSISGVTWPDNIDSLASVLEAIGDASKKTHGMDKGGQLPDVLDVCGPAIKKFSDDVAGVTIPDLSDLADTVQVIGDVSDSASTINYDLFGTILDTISEELTKFVEDMSGITWPDLTELTDMISSLADIANGVDDIDTSKLSDILGNFGTEVANFATEMEGVTPDDVSGLSDLIKAISDATISVDEIDTTQLSTVLTELSSFATGIQEIEWPEDLGGMKNCIQAIQDACDEFANIQWPDTESLNNLSTQIQTAMDQLGEGLVLDFLTAVENSSADIIAAGSKAIDYFVSGMNSSDTTDISAKVKEICDSIIAAFKEYDTDFEEAGSHAISEFAVGMEQGTEPLLTTVYAICNYLVQAFMSVGPSFMSAGYYVIYYFVLGMTVGASAAVSIAISICSLVLSAFMSVGPAFMSAGYYVIYYFALGMTVGASAAVSIAISICNALIQVFISVGSAFEVAGLNLMIYLANGMSVGGNLVVSVALEIVNLVYYALESFASVCYLAGALWTTSLANGMAQGASLVTSAVLAIINLVYYGFDSFSSVCYLAGVLWTTSLAAGMSSAISFLDTIAAGVCVCAINVLRSAYSDFVAVGTYLISGLAKGIEAGSYDVQNAVMKVAYSAALSANNQYSNFYTVGHNFSIGIANGILSGASAVVQAAVSVASLAVRAVMSCLSIHSPSKVTTELGGYFDQGFVNGILAFIPLVKNASREVAEEAVGAVGSGLDSMADIIEDNMDLNPVITPVVDLSEVTAGAKAIGDMFADSSRMSVKTDQVVDASNSVARFQSGQDFENNRLLSAISDLSTRLNETRGGDTYNINGVTYDDGSNVADAVQQLFRAAKMERRA